MGSIPIAIIERMRQSATMPQTAVSLRQMVEFGQYLLAAITSHSFTPWLTLPTGTPYVGRTPSQATMLRATQFIHNELPIRLARRAVELETLPDALSKMPSVIRVKNWYTQSYRELIEFPKPDAFGVPKAVMEMKLAAAAAADKIVPTGAGVGGARGLNVRYFNPIKDENLPPEVAAYNSKFVECIESIKKRHDPVATTLAKGIQELKDHWKRTNSPYLKSANGLPAQTLPVDIHSFLDRFYMSRIGIRMLIGQHVALARASENPSATPPEYVGIINTHTSLRKVALEAAENAKVVCQDFYGLWGGPEIRLLMGNSEDVDFMYVPSHLHHMLFELLKNSLRAVVERFGVDADEYPEIRVVVAEGREDITIKISDEGGGIPRSGMPLIWTYMYTTAEKPELEEGFSKSDFRAPLAGFGYGLPLSRLYARYFGGDLRLISMEGYG
ncbi:hypothetical protein HK101_004037 [Irineochytrium annulatum]|nr:hypothetical protein HK101_004037 [Irineochytrium annulatum]